MKKVLYIIIDALATRVVEPALEEGRLPNFKKIIHAGQMQSDSIAIFPSITPAATCTLATGHYPFEHGISGAYWYNQETDDVAYFGDDIWAILNEGVDSYLLDFQRDLNEKRLQVPTIFELIEPHGHLRDAVINLFWFHGTVEHEVSLPLVFNLLPAEPAQKIRGPHLMFMGDFVNTPLMRGQELNARGGMLRRYGFHDDTTADYLLQLAEAEGLPDFTLAYFPNNDFDSHTEGPQEAVHDLESIDEHLGRLFEIYGGIEKLLDEVAVVITGDHSQSDNDSAQEAAVYLDEVLAEHQVVKVGSSWQSGDDVMVCPNMRAAQIYLRADSWENRQQVIESLLASDGVDQVIWCAVDNGLNETEHAQFNVATAERGRLSFALAGESEPMGVDDYGAGWRWHGDLATVDATLDSDGRLQFGDYPNAFERIATAFFQQSGNIWVTARLGREFCLPETTCHDGGSHGSLHALDSTSPLITAGIPTNVSLPEYPRSVDVVPICLQVLGLATPRKSGESHVQQISRSELSQVTP